ncbi:hypothetical protein [Helicobacter sp. 11S02629-2]|uniref:hypothetical protein n=1 Tax=Helicobacter sp. 11S02629-2 TaxID=1476195 RepID=UPI000BA720C6|nr:hypothetical protein [Helicobacter sp. 11S02629-2]PAF42748.1 hypothetical protein BKH40_07590 [Helicobacter sp. 11S02629-2]
MAEENAVTTENKEVVEEKKEATPESEVSNPQDGREASLSASPKSEDTTSSTQAGSQDKRSDTLLQDESLPSTMAFDTTKFVTGVNPENNKKKLVLNDVNDLKIEDEIYILNVKYIIKDIDSQTKTITLDKDTHQEINLQTNKTIEVRKLKSTPLVVETKTPLVKGDKLAKLKSIINTYLQKLQARHDASFSEYKGMADILEDEAKSYLNTFDKALTPAMDIINQESEAPRELGSVILETKKNIQDYKLYHELLKARLKLILKAINKATSKEDLNALSLEDA